MVGGNRQKQLAPVACVVAVALAAAARGQDFSELEGIAPGWIEIGNFRGSTSTLLVEQFNDLLFEQESEGALYRDLGTISLGLGVDFDGDNGEVDWHSSFSRRVLPLHREVAPGEEVTARDVSTYLDVDTVVTRGRVAWDYLANVLEGSGVGVQVDYGSSLTLARARPPLELEGRPLEELLADLPAPTSLARPGVPLGDKSALRLGTEAIAGAADWIGRQVARGFADTEQGQLFFEDYGQPVTLFIDLGLPIEAELFLAADDRLAVGDRVQHITFAALSPLQFRVGKAGLTTGLQRFYRFQRETTLVKEADDRVLVRVRDGLHRGLEVTPLRFRPELRLLGILSIGYTFFEYLLDRGRVASSEAVYRIDLEQPDGMHALQALLGQGGRVTLQPLQVAARDGGGVELLDRELRSGQQQRDLLRARAFSLYDKRTQGTAADEIVVRDDGRRRELVRGSSSSLTKRVGRRRSWGRELLVTAQSEVVSDDGGELGVPSQVPVSLTILSGFFDDHAWGTQVERAARLLRLGLPGQEDEETLLALASVAPDSERRLGLGLRLVFARSHLQRWADVGEEELWRELAALFLGESKRSAWQDEGDRREWRELLRRGEAVVSGEEAIDGYRLHRRRGTDSRRKLARARRLARRFEALQRLARDGNCASCLADAFSSWKDSSAMIVLLSRLAGAPAGRDVGYAYELFTDGMERPLSRSNGLDYELPTRWEAFAAALHPAPAVESERVEASPAGDRWGGAATEQLALPSEPRIHAGVLLRRRTTEDGSDCFRLLLFSDQRFAAGLRLRYDLRRSGAKDRTIAVHFAELGSQIELSPSPFMTSRYMYQVPVAPEIAVEEEGRYTLLLRVLNEQGLPVSEEQQLRFQVPREMFDDMPAACAGQRLERPDVR